MDETKKLVLMHAALGLLAGYVSPLLGRALYAVGLVIAAAFLLAQATPRLFGKKDLGWWAGNGLVVFLFVWLDAWILLINI